MYVDNLVLRVLSLPRERSRKYFHEVERGPWEQGWYVEAYKTLCHKSVFFYNMRCHVCNRSLHIISVPKSSKGYLRNVKMNVAFAPAII